jgi:membrane protein implicated in regulation of membrane protease activity
MDDGPRIGALQLLLLLIGGGAGLIAWAIIALDDDLLAAPVPTLIALACLAGIIRLELYARRRAREDREDRERRLREAGTHRPPPGLPEDPFA